MEAAFRTLQEAQAAENAAFEQALRAVLQQFGRTIQIHQTVIFPKVQ